MKTIRRYFNPGDAGFASSLLEAADIPTLVKDVDCYLFTPGPATGGIQLQVADEDVEWANEVLNQPPISPATYVAPDSAAGGEASTGVLRDESSMDEPEGNQIPVAVFILAAATLAVLGFAIHKWEQGLEQPRGALWLQRLR
jgi:hypothetical protein